MNLFLSFRRRSFRWFVVVFILLIFIWTFFLFENLSIQTEQTPKENRPIFREKISQKARQSDRQVFLERNPVKYNYHIFYYPWYGNPQFDDGRFYHWNHRRLAHWNKEKALKYPQHRHRPPDDIGSNFYPFLGTYSSRSDKVLDEHMKMIRMSGAGTLSISWYPPGMADDEGHSWDDLIPKILDFAGKYELQVCFHIEPYANRTAQNTIEWSSYILRQYGKHAAFYRHDNKALFYVYDSYQISTEDWRRAFQSKSSQMFLVGLILKPTDCSELLKAGFDGAYSYFAADGFTEASNSNRWSSIVEQCRPLTFIPSVGPGYIDTNIRPWNGETTRLRNNGEYYRKMFANLPKIQDETFFVTITSFNEWAEGTQIEPAADLNPTRMIAYETYHQGPLTYIKLTRQLIFQRQ